MQLDRGDGTKKGLMRLAGCRWHGAAADMKVDAVYQRLFVVKCEGIKTDAETADEVQTVHLQYSSQRTFRQGPPH